MLCCGSQTQHFSLLCEKCLYSSGCFVKTRYARNVSSFAVGRTSVGL